MSFITSSYIFLIDNCYFLIASIVMYEQAYRLKTETEANSRSLNQRVQCLLSTMTCLELVHASNAWVERPDIRKGILGHDRNVEV